MTKKAPSTRQRLETLQESRAMTIDELASIDDQLTALQARKDELEAALADPEGTITAGAAGDLGDILSQLANLERVRSSLEKRKTAQNAAIKAELDQVNQAAVLAARAGEREAFEKVIDAAGVLWSAIVEYDKYLHERIYPYRGQPLTGIPGDLIAWVNPGGHGAFRQWARTDRIGGPDSAA